MKKQDVYEKRVRESVIRAITKMASTLLPRYGETEITCEQIIKNMDINFSYPNEGKEEVSRAVFYIMQEGGGEILWGEGRFIKVAVLPSDSLYEFKLYHNQSTKLECSKKGSRQKILNLLKRNPKKQ